MPRRYHVLICCFLFLLVGTIQRVHSFNQLIAKVPKSANVITLIDVERTLASPLAQEQGWGKELELAYVERPVYLPPEATKLVLAANLLTAQDFQRQWELGVMSLSDPLSMRSIARSEGGYVDEVAGKDVAWTPSDAYFVGLSERELGVMFPADRQRVSRWIQYAQGAAFGDLSDYLNEAVRGTNKNVQVMMAMDLTDVVQPHEVDQRIKESKLFSEAKLDSDKLMPVLTSIRGASLRLIIDDYAKAQLRVDFGTDASVLKPIAKDLVTDVLSELGVAVSDMQSWKAEVKDNAIRMQGKLSQDGLRRIFSVIELPSAKFSMLKEESGGAGQPNESQVREASLVYFRSIDSLLKDLKRDLRDSRASAAIMERYAGRIDRMPILHVDSELLDYGAGIAKILRAIALSKRQGGIDYGVNTAGMGRGGYTNYSYNYGYFGGGDRYAGARASAADRASMKAEALAGSKNARVEGSKMIADQTAEIRRKMTEKYQVEF